MSIPRHQFIVFRLLSSLGLALFWVTLIVQGEQTFEYWHRFFGHVEWKSLVSFFPNILALFDSPEVLASVACMSSLLLGLGLYRKFNASLSLYALACFHHSEYLELTPLSLIVVVVLIELMIAPEKEHVKKAWLLKRWHAQAAGVVMLFLTALLINPFALPQRLMQNVEAIYFFPLWLHVLLTLSFLILPVKPFRWVFWLLQILMITVMAILGLEFGPLLLLFALMVLSIDPHWLISAHQDPPRDLIAFYDGNCGLCHRLVQFLLEIDQREIIKFSPLQSAYAHNYLRGKADMLKEMKTLVVHSKGDNLVKSKAALELFRYLGGIWSLLSFFRFVPQRISDFFYDLIAQRRYQFFGQFEGCPLPSSEERERFLISDPSETSEND